MINSKLNELRNDYRRIEAIKDVLEYNLRSNKNQISIDLKKLEDKIKVDQIAESIFEGN
jgi:hypothetical protein